MSLTVAQLAQKLASVEQYKRDEAIESAKSWLKENKDFSELTCRKFWQGVFYCFWLADKELYQHNVAQTIAEFMHNIQGGWKPKLTFIKTFLSTLDENWKNLDVHRVAKYMSLVRKFLNQSLVFLRNHKFQPKLLLKYNAVLKAGPLKPASVSLSNSLQIHLAEIFIEEAEKVCAETMNGNQFQLLVRPYVELLAQTTDEGVKKAIDESILGEIADYKNRAKEQEDTPKKQQMEIIEERLKELESANRTSKYTLPVDFKKMSELLIELAGKPTTRNRNEIYKYQQAFETSYKQELVDKPEGAESLLSDVANELQQLQSQPNGSAKKRKASEREQAKEEEDDDDDEEEEESEPSPKKAVAQPAKKQKKEEAKPVAKSKPAKAEKTSKPQKEESKPASKQQKEQPAAANGKAQKQEQKKSEKQQAAPASKKQAKQPAKVEEEEDDDIDMEELSNIKEESEEEEEAPAPKKGKKQAQGKQQQQPAAKKQPEVKKETKKEAKKETKKESKPAKQPTEEAPVSPKKVNFALDSNKVQLFHKENAVETISKGTAAVPPPAAPSSKKLKMKAVRKSVKK